MNKIRKISAFFEIKVFPNNVYLKFLIVLPKIIAKFILQDIGLNYSLQYISKFYCKFEDAR